jgi:hypothetical protein
MDSKTATVWPTQVVYCGGISDSSDHTPPQCLLPRKLPASFQAMTVPACAACNNSYSQDEMRLAAIIGTISFTTADREAVAPGGWIYSALQQDNALRAFINDRLGSDGIFRVEGDVVCVLTRVMQKTAAGLLFYEFGKLIRPSDCTILTAEHSKNIEATALVESYRRDDSGWPEVTPSGRELERHVMAAYGLPPRHMPKWRIYVPEFFEYMFIRRSNRKLLCAIKLHDALTILLQCAWASAAGPRRRSRPRSTGPSSSHPKAKR